MIVLTPLENKAQLASLVYILLQDFMAYLKDGSGRANFESETDRLLSKLPCQERNWQLRSFQEVFELAHWKLEGHLQSNLSCFTRQ